MVISREPAMTMRDVVAESPEEPLPRELQYFQHLIEQLTADGTLSRWEEEAIMAALVTGGLAYSSEKCGLFRQLQERVWRAELYLEPS